MPVEAVAAAPRAARPLPVQFVPPPARSWACEIVARLVTGLVQRPVTADEIQRRAVGLGLLRHPALGRTGELDAKSIARLLLSAYHLPAHLEYGTVPLLEAHLAGGRRAWVVLPNGETTTVYQVISLSRDPFGEIRVAVREVGDRFVVEEQLPVDRFAERWAAAGGLLVVAAVAWAELPPTGSLFFGGLRDRDGSYHWVAAECDTDKEGRILRC